MCLSKVLLFLLRNFTSFGFVTLQEMKSKIIRFNCLHYQLLTIGNGSSCVCFGYGSKNDHRCSVLAVKATEILREVLSWSSSLFQLKELYCLTQASFIAPKAIHNYRSCNVYIQHGSGFLRSSRPSRQTTL